MTTIRQNPKQIKRYTLRTLYPKWKEYKRLHTTAETYIMRIDTDWKTYYMGTEIIDIPIQKLDKLTLDNWAHQLIKDHERTAVGGLPQSYTCKAGEKKQPNRVSKAREPA